MFSLVRVSTRSVQLKRYHVLMGLSQSRVLPSGREREGAWCCLGGTREESSKSTDILDTDTRALINRNVAQSTAAKERIQMMRDRYAILYEYAATKPLSAREAREYKEVEEALDIVSELEAKENEAEELRALMNELHSSENDKELYDEADRELNEIIEPRIRQLESSLASKLLPKSEDEEEEALCDGALLEVRAAAGGLEAGFFAKEILDMYDKYAHLRNWKFEILEQTAESTNGIKSAFALIKGAEAFQDLKLESGVHRVQRVPQNSTKIHTSTVSVVISPQRDDDTTGDVSPLPNSEIRFDTYRASGAGGQHVNKTDSAVRATHIPTGTVVAIQDERSQHRNKAKALRVLAARVHAQQVQAQNQQRQESRSKLAISGERGERIRTYNYPHDRVVDHRCHFTTQSVSNTLDGHLLHDIILHLKLQLHDEKLNEFLQSFPGSSLDESTTSSSSSSGGGTGISQSRRSSSSLSQQASPIQSVF